MKGDQCCHCVCGVVQVMALEIQAQQLQTILSKRAADSRAATVASDDVLAQVCPHLIMPQRVALWSSVYACTDRERLRSS